jgi:hypothetical protein
MELLETLEWIRDQLNVGAWDYKPDDIMTALNQAILQVPCKTSEDQEPEKGQGPPQPVQPIRSKEK